MKVENRRQYQRVNTLLPFDVRRHDPAGSEDLQCRVVTGGIILNDSPPLPVEDERLNAWLNMLNAKLDYLIQANRPQQKVRPPIAFEPVNISGNGMMMMTTDTYEVGNILEIKMILQTYPAKILHLYGEVLRIEDIPKRPNASMIGIKFLGMTEEVREEILKFNFKKHGEMLLMRKGAPCRTPDER